MRSNANITLYNKWYNPLTQREEYFRICIPSVSWNDRTAVRLISGGGSIAQDKTVIYMPYARGTSTFVVPKVWTELEDKSTKWTLQEDDIIVLGTLDQDLSADYTPADLAEEYDSIRTISVVQPRTMGSVSMHHWEIGAR